MAGVGRRKSSAKMCSQMRCRRGMTVSSLLTFVFVVMGVVFIIDGARERKNRSSGAGSEVREKAPPPARAVPEWDGSKESMLTDGLESKMRGITESHEKRGDQLERMLQELDRLIP